mmetsp:Transcript_5004/g.12255  ORF Transcript_5004/g.12255 Transcript_5004/m.12255 type:complete len:210 (-) Transcript_5004:147-776(-)
MVHRTPRTTIPSTCAPRNAVLGYWRRCLFRNLSSTRSSVDLLDCEFCSRTFVNLAPKARLTKNSSGDSLVLSSEAAPLFINFRLASSVLSMFSIFASSPKSTSTKPVSQFILSASAAAASGTARCSGISYSSSTRDFFTTTSAACTPIFFLSKRSARKAFRCLSSSRFAPEPEEPNLLSRSPYSSSEFSSSSSSTSGMLGIPFRFALSF